MTPGAQQGVLGFAAQFSEALNDRMKQLDRGSDATCDAVRFKDATAGWIPVLDANLRREEINAQRRCVGRPCDVIIAIDAARGIETAVDSGRQGACQGMEKGNIAYVLKCDVYEGVSENRRRGWDRSERR